MDKLGTWRQEPDCETLMGHWRAMVGGGQVEEFKSEKQDEHFHKIKFSCTMIQDLDNIDDDE